MEGEITNSGWWGSRILHAAHVTDAGCGQADMACDFAVWLPFGAPLGGAAVPGHEGVRDFAPSLRAELGDVVAVLALAKKEHQRIDVALHQAVQDVDR